MSKELIRTRARAASKSGKGSFISLAALKSPRCDAVQIVSNKSSLMSKLSITSSADNEETDRSSSSDFQLAKDLQFQALIDLSDSHTDERIRNLAKDCMTSLHRTDQGSIGLVDGGLEPFFRLATEESVSFMRADTVSYLTTLAHDGVVATQLLAEGALEKFVSLACVEKEDEVVAAILLFLSNLVLHEEAADDRDRFSTQQFAKICTTDMLARYEKTTALCIGFLNLMSNLLCDNLSRLPTLLSTEVIPWCNSQLLNNASEAVCAAAASVLANLCSICSDGDTLVKLLPSVKQGDDFIVKISGFMAKFSSVTDQKQQMQRIEELMVKDASGNADPLHAVTRACTRLLANMSCRDVLLRELEQSCDIALVAKLLKCSDPALQLSALQLLNNILGAAHNAASVPSDADGNKRVVDAAAESDSGEEEDEDDFFYDDNMNEEEKKSKVASSQSIQRENALSHVESLRARCIEAGAKDSLSLLSFDDSRIVREAGILLQILNGTAPSTLTPQTVNIGDEFDDDTLHSKIIDVDVVDDDEDDEDDEQNASVTPLKRDFQTIALGSLLGASQRLSNMKSFQDLASSRAAKFGDKNELHTGSTSALNDAQLVRSVIDDESKGAVMIVKVVFRQLRKKVKVRELMSIEEALFVLKHKFKIDSMKDEDDDNSKSTELVLYLLNPSATSPRVPTTVATPDGTLLHDLKQALRDAGVKNDSSLELLPLHDEARKEVNDAVRAFLTAVYNNKNYDAMFVKEHVDTLKRLACEGAETREHLRYRTVLLRHLLDVCKDVVPLMKLEPPLLDETTMTEIRTAAGYTSDPDDNGDLKFVCSPKIEDEIYVYYNSWNAEQRRRKKLCCRLLRLYLAVLGAHGESRLQTVRTDGSFALLLKIATCNHPRVQRLALQILTQLVAMKQSANALALAESGFLINIVNSCLDWAKSPHVQAEALLFLTEMVLCGPDVAVCVAQCAASTIVYLIQSRVPAIAVNALRCCQELSVSGSRLASDLLRDSQLASSFVALLPVPRCKAVSTEIFRAIHMSVLDDLRMKEDLANIGVFSDLLYILATSPLECVVKEVARVIAEFCVESPKVQSKMRVLNGMFALNRLLSWPAPPPPAAKLPPSSPRMPTPSSPLPLDFSTKPQELEFSSDDVSSSSYESSTSSGGSTSSTDDDLRTAFEQRFFELGLGASSQRKVDQVVERTPVHVFACQALIAAVQRNRGNQSALIAVPGAVEALCGLLSKRHLETVTLAAQACQYVAADYGQAKKALKKAGVIDVAKESLNSWTSSSAQEVELRSAIRALLELLGVKTEGARARSKSAGGVSKTVSSSSDGDSSSLQPPPSLQRAASEQAMVDALLLDVELKLADGITKSGDAGRLKLFAEKCQFTRKSKTFQFSLKHMDFVRIVTGKRGNKFLTFTGRQSASSKPTTLFGSSPDAEKVRDVFNKAIRDMSKKARLAQYYASGSNSLQRNSLTTHSWDAELQ